MGYGSSVTLPKKTKLKDVKKFLHLLKYQELEKGYFFYNDNGSEEHFTGVTLTIGKNKTENIELYLRTTVWTTVADTKYTNLTLSEVSQRFGGHYRTENGKNRPYKFGGTERKNAEAGCFTVFMTFKNNMVKPNVFHQHLEMQLQERSLTDLWIINEYHPASIGMNISIPFLISVFEEYFTSTFIVLLKWSDNKKEILKGLRINTEDLADVSSGISSIEKVASRNISFQNISSINSTFDKISKEIKFIHLLKSQEPKKKYFERINIQIEFRHQIIHNNFTNPFYDIQEFKKDLNLVFEICELFYDRLIEINNWEAKKY
ncbi:MAG: hypothetical protein ABI315_02215 [Bacteroidia bacterium]